jgi:predicted peptidase
MYILIKRIIRLFLLSLFAVWMITSACPASADGKWQKYELPAGDTDASPYMHYWVYTPDDLKPGLPLVVYLHSSSGMINSALRNEESGLPSLIISGEIPAPESIVLVPQHPGLFDDTWSMVLDSVIACVEKVACDYKVDRSRISLTGFSLGGIGMWDLVVAKPGVYSRLLCLDARINKLSQLPECFRGCEIRIYTARRDQAINTDTLFRFVSQLDGAGIPVACTELDSVHQELPKAVYSDESVREWLWLNAENKNAPEKTPAP